MTTAVVTALLVDDHELLRQGLRRALERTGSVVVVGEAAGVAEGLAYEESLRPHVLVVDVNMPDGSGLELVRAIRARRPSIGIVVLTMYSDDEHLFAALEAGASAFVVKSAPAEEVLSAVRHASASPGSFSGSGLAAALRRRMAGPDLALTSREAAVLNLLKDGLPVAAIAQALYISHSTAKTHIAKLYDKLGAGNRTQALMTALRMGLISESPSPGLAASRRS